MVKVEVLISDNLVLALSVLTTNLLYNWKPCMVSEDYRRGICLDDLDNGNKMNATDYIYHFWLKKVMNIIET